MKPFHALALCLSIAGLLAACAGEDESGIVGVRKPKPKASASEAPGATPSPGVGGNVETGGIGLPTVRYVTVSPASLSLNAPAADGFAYASLPIGTILSAQVVLSNDEADPKGVTWSVSDPSRLMSDGHGGLSIKPGAAPGAVVVTATTVTDPTKKAHAFIQVTNDGVLDLTVQPQDEAEELGQTYLSVSRLNGSPVLYQQIPVSARVRLPAGTYQALIQSLTMAGALQARLQSFTIAPNTVLATASALK